MTIQGHFDDRGAVFSYVSKRHEANGQVWWKATVKITLGERTIGFGHGVGKTGNEARAAALNAAKADRASRGIG